MRCVVLDVFVRMYTIGLQRWDVGAYVLARYSGVGWRASVVGGL